LEVAPVAPRARLVLTRSGSMESSQTLVPVAMSDWRGVAADMRAPLLPGGWDGATPPLYRGGGPSAYSFADSSLSGGAEPKRRDEQGAAEGGGAGAGGLAGPPLDGPPQGLAPAGPGGAQVQQRPRRQGELTLVRRRVVEEVQLAPPGLDVAADEAAEQGQARLHAGRHVEGAARLVVRHLAGADEAVRRRHGPAAHAQHGQFDAAAPPQAADDLVARGQKVRRAEGAGAGPALVWHADDGPLEAARL